MMIVVVQQSYKMDIGKMWRSESNIKNCEAIEPVLKSCNEDKASPHSWALERFLKFLFRD